MITANVGMWTVTHKINDDTNSVAVKFDTKTIYVGYTEMDNVEWLAGLLHSIFGDKEPRLNSTQFSILVNTIIHQNIKIATLRMHVEALGASYRELANAAA
jgi:hypothetical protein